MDISAATATTKVLPMRKARSLQERLPKQAEIQGEHLRRVNTYWDKKPTVEVMATVEEVKRGRREVIDSTCSAKDLVSSGTQIALEKCTHMLVVSTVHSNIPATSQSDQELNKNHTGSQEPAVVRLRLDLRRVAYYR